MADVSSDLNIGETVIDLNNEFITQLLRLSEKDDELEVLDFQTKPLTKKGDNYTSFILGLDVTTRPGGNCAEKEFHLVAKLAPANEARLKFLETTNIFPKENFMYNVIIPELIEIQKKHGVTDIIKPAVPKLYTSIEEKQMVLVFENLITDGYRMAEKLNGCTIKQAELVMLELARFHALSYPLLQDLDVPVLEKYPLLKDMFQLEAFQEQGKMFVDQAMGMSIDMLSGYLTSSGKTDIFDKIQAIKTTGGATFEKMTNRRDGMIVINHGDCWINNMMFKYDSTDDQEPIGVNFVDLQLSRVVNCNMDLAYFIYTSTDVEIRKNHMERLLGLYHREFLNTVKKLNMEEPENFTFADLLEQFHSFKIVGLVLAFMVLPMMLARPEETMDMEKFNMEDFENPEKMKELMMESQAKLKDNQIFFKRILDVVEDMVRDGII